MANTKIQSEQIEDDIALGGNPTTTTQSAGNNTTRVATTAFVTTAVANLVDSAPSALDTLNELAAAMGDDASFSTTITNSIATKLPLAGGTMTGNLEIDVGSGTNAGITLRMGTGSSGANDSFIGFENSAGTEVIRTRYDNPTTSYVISSDTSGDIVTVQRGGNVGIGGTPTKPLTVFTSAASDSARFTDNTNSELLIEHASGNLLTLATGSTSQPFAFAQGSTEAMRISNSNVGIGTSSPTTTYNRQLHIHGAGGYGGSLHLTDTGSGSGAGDGFELISYNTTAYVWQRDNANLLFGTNQAERMRIDSNGNLLVATTDVSQYNNASGADHGTVIGASSFIDISRNGNPMLYLNRTDSDGQLAYFSREGSGKGALSTRSGYIWLETVTSDGSDTSGVVLDGGAGGGSTARGAVIAAYGNENSSFPGQINLQPGASGKVQTYYGASATAGAAFNSSGNLTFPSGKGIDFSATSDGTSAQNELLDDYEEGIWTPTLPNGGSISNVGSNYTKIGRLVNITSYVQVITPTNNSSALQIGGLPFTVWGSGYTYSAGSFSYIGTSSGNVNRFGLLASPGNSYLYFHFIDGSGGSAVTNANWIAEMGSGTGIHLIFHAFFYTDS